MSGCRTWDGEDPVPRQAQSGSSQEQRESPTLAQLSFSRMSAGQTWACSCREPERKPGQPGSD